MKILHVLKTPQATDALAIARHHQAAEGHQVTVLLIQDGLYTPSQPGLDLLVCNQDLQARGLTRGEKAVSHEEIIDLIFSHDRIICW